MKRLRIVGLASLTLVLACGDPPPPDATKPLESRVELAAGDVWLEAEEGEERIITGAMLASDSRLRVGEDGRALIRLSSGTGVFMRSGSEVSLGERALVLAKGELWADVPREDEELARFDAGDVSVTASESGFDLAFDGERVSLYVARGLAVLNAPGGRVEVQSGEMAVATGDAAPTVEPVSFWEDWTGGMADRELGMRTGGAGRIYGIDRARQGSPPQELQITSQKVRVVIREGIAHTTVDQRFFNPSSTPLEGWYWFTIPEGASVERFALEVDGALVDGEMIERKQAAAAYEEAVQKSFDPALLEWVDGRTFRAKIYPIPAVGDRRVVLSYTEMLPMVDSTLRYTYPMGGTGEVQIQEFSLKVDLGEEGENMEISTGQDARVERDRTVVSMRRSGYVPRSDFLLEMRLEDEPEPMRIARYSTGEDEADYVMIRYSPQVEWGGVKEIPGDVVVVVDTSAGGDDSDRQVRAEAVDAILRSLSGKDRFALVATDLAPRVVYPDEGLADAKDENVSAALERLAEINSAGATDLGEMFNTALERVHESIQPAVVYVGDGRATVGETTHDELTKRLRRSMGESRARLFSIAVGDDANYSLLERLARVGGGRMFRIDTPEETVQQALRFAGWVKTPTVTDLEIDAGAGLDQLFSTSQGKVSQGEEVILLARTHHALPDQVLVRGRLGGEDFEREYAAKVEKGDEHSYIKNLWARMYLKRLMGEGLEENRGSIIALGINHALMTPFTSFLVLESDDAYRQQGIERRKRDSRWTMTEQERDAELLAAVSGSAAGAALLPMGCADLSGSSDEAPPREEVPEWLKADRRDEEQGGKGKRHKGEEGQMGKRDAAKTDNHYGIKGPRDNPDPHMARSAEEGAADQGVLGSLAAPSEPGGGEGLGYGGLKLEGTGRGGGGTGEGTIGLGNLDTIGHGGGGGTGSGYGRGSGGLGGKRAKAPRVRSGAAQVKGSLSKEVIRRIIHRHINEVKFCYERVLSEQPDISGRANVKFIISGTGAVQMAAMASSTLGNPRVENCLVRAVKRWTFPQPDGGGIVIVTYPFVFSSGDAPEPELAPVESAPVAPAQIATGNPYSGAVRSPFSRKVCSDASRRPLAQRRILWAKRLSRATGPDEMAGIFFEAGERCELDNWRSRKSMLDLIEARTTEAKDVTTLLAAFQGYPTFARYLRRRILKKALDPDLATGLYFPSSVDWASVRRGIAAMKTDEARLEEVRKILSRHPDDPAGRTLLLEVLASVGEEEEALAVASRLKRDGFAGPLVLKILCDLQASAGMEMEARRSCSELVEFNPENQLARRQLGDLFLRHKWYSEAYRQFKTLVDSAGDNPIALLRLAAAAAGMGKTDEALRLERKVASGEGEPGSSDPRLWARLLSAARIAGMILEAKKANEGDKVGALERSLKRTQVAAQRSTLMIMVWDDLEAGLTMNPMAGDEDLTVSDRVNAPGVGLAMIDVGESVPEGFELAVRTGGALIRPVEFELYTISWDGKSFSISSERGEIPPGETEIVHSTRS